MQKTHPEFGDDSVIFLKVQEAGSDKEPMGFNCGPSNHEKANMIATELYHGLKGGMEVSGPVKTPHKDYIVTVTCQPGTLRSVQPLVEMSVAIWRRRGDIH